MRGQLALAGFAGIVQTVGLAWPWDHLFVHGHSLWWLQTMSLVAYAWAIEMSPTKWQAGRVGLVFHVSLLTSSLYWLYVAMNTYGGLAAWLAASAVIALATGLALFGATAAMLYAQWRREGLARRASLFAATWLLAELARGQWLTGFGWASSGYAHTDGPFASLAPWVGVYGIGFLCALWAGVFTQSVLRKHRVYALACVVSLVLMGRGFGQEAFTQPGASIRVALLQGNIAQNEKFESSTGVAMALSWYGEQLHSAQADLVLAPETAIPVLPQQLPVGYWDGVKPTTAAQEMVQLSGIPMGSYSEGYTNSVVDLRGLPDRVKYRYDKRHLVPFGEFIPPMFKWFVRLMNIPLGDFNRGALLQKNVAVGNARVSPSICFEDLFAEELAVRFLVQADSPTIFANFSNLAWFGDTTAMYQHLHISQMRSLEFERPFLRVSNTGVTSVLDHQGQVTAVLEPLTRGVLHASVQGREGLTPFARWSSRWGQWPLWILGLALLLEAYRQRPGSPGDPADAPQT